MTRPKEAQWTSIVDGRTTKFYRFFVSFLGDNVVDPHLQVEVYTDDDAQHAEDTFNNLLKCARQGLDIRIEADDNDKPFIRTWVETPEGVLHAEQIELFSYQDADEVASALRKELEVERP